MQFEFRDAKLQIEKRDGEFKEATPVTPCVTCTSIGDLVGAGGDPVSAKVEGEPDYVWVVAYGDSSPFPVLNKGVVATQTALAVLIGYAEGSIEREILSYNEDVLSSEVSIGHLTAGQDPNISVMRDTLATLRVVPVRGTLSVSVYGMEYNRFGARQTFPGPVVFDLTSYLPASGKKRWVLLYLDGMTMVLSVVLGDIGPDHPTHVLSKPNTPLYGFGTVFVNLAGDASEILEADIEDARRTLYPNKVAGVVYNRVVTELIIPSDFTYIRGVLVVEPNQVLRIESGGRVIIT